MPWIVPFVGLPVLGPDSIFLLTKEPAMTRHADTFAYSCKRGGQEHLSVFARDVGVVRGIQPLSVMRDAGFGVLCLMNVAAWVVPSQSLHSGCDDAVAATDALVLFRVARGIGCCRRRSVRTFLRHPVWESFLLRIAR